MITVLPEGGLCNRMRVVASAWLLAQKSGQGLRVLWYQTPDFNAPFSLLFETAGLPFEIVERRAMSRMARLGFRLREAWSRLRGFVVLGNAETEPGLFDMAATVGLVRGREVFIRTNSRLAVEPGMYGLFLPTGEAQDILARLHPELENCVGVHVRRTDNVNATRFSTLDEFIQQMHVELQASDCRFFLASDSPEVAERMTQVFGSRVWGYEKRAYSRDNPQAIVDAVVDLYALGRCRKLIGSYWSSFTDTAAELNDIPCYIAGKPGPLQ